MQVLVSFLRPLITWRDVFPLRIGGWVRLNDRLLKKTFGNRRAFEKKCRQEYCAGFSAPTWTFKPRSHRIAHLISYHLIWTELKLTGHGTLLSSVQLSSYEMSWTVWTFLYTVCTVLLTGETPLAHDATNVGTFREMIIKIRRICLCRAAILWLDSLDRQCIIRLLTADDIDPRYQPWFTAGKL